MRRWSFINQGRGGGETQPSANFIMTKTMFSTTIINHSCSWCILIRYKTMPWSFLFTFTFIIYILRFLIYKNHHNSEIWYKNYFTPLTIKSYYWIITKKNYLNQHGSVHYLHPFTSLLLLKVMTALLKIFTCLASSISIGIWNEYLLHIWDNFNWLIEVYGTIVYMPIRVFLTKFNPFSTNVPLL